MKKQICQSCGKPIRNVSDYGTEKMGTHSFEYCYDCYKDGKYVQPDLTVNEVIEKGRGAIENLEVSRLEKRVLKILYPIQIKKLKRWK